MNFLTSLGIEFKLLLAQIINFAILILILKKFVFKHALKRIEDDEAKLKKAQEAMDEVEKEKTQLTQQKKQILKDAQKRAQDTIQEAENIAEEVVAQARKKSKAETEKVVEWVKNKSLSQQSKKEKVLTDNIKKELQSAILSKVRSVFAESENIDKAYFNLLIKDVSGINQNLIKEVAGKLTLEYAHEIDDKQRQELEESLEKAFGKKTQMDANQNNELIAGYKLTAEDFIINENLLNDIEDAEK